LLFSQSTVCVYCESEHCHMRNFLLTFCFMLAVSAYAQNEQATVDRPKLVVGIMVDQMRQEYLLRFYPKYGEGGFKRLMSDGFSLRNAHYNYVPTETGPGHASVYTGSTPALHGIIGNDWYDKNEKKEVNCVNDPSQKVVGSATGAGEVSPWRMMTTTITDELELFTHKKSKVIGVSWKDRGAVLPVGHMGDAAYWFDKTTGNFITSTYYMKQVPAWVEQFNAQKLADQLLNKEWTTLYPIERYTESAADDNVYESKLGGKEKPTFPYNLKELRKNSDYDFLGYTPYGNDYITAFAKAALTAEKLGKNAATDFLAVSYSCTDKLGHEVGPNAIEIEDVYLRLDKNIEDLLKQLDAQVGKGNYTVFLTADHAIADVAQYLVDNRMPGGYFRPANVKAELNEHLKKYFPGKDLVKVVESNQLYFDHEAFNTDPRNAGIEMLIATELAVNFLLQQPGVANAYPENIMRQGRYDEAGPKGAAIRGYHPKRSGDIAIVLESGWYAGWKVTSTTHGSSYAYDTHVPVLFYGYGIKKGSSVKYHPITDIAPTLSMILNIKIPSGATGQPIEEIFEK
jgi:predicted AlkP superfamily pyrophosphatase or phosphodiesterase